MVSGAVLFVLGFTVIFVAEGVLFGSLGAAIRDHTVLIERILGVVTIVMGVVFLGGIRLPAARVPHSPAARPRAWSARRCSAPRSGWPGRPCLTPTFAAVYALAFSRAPRGGARSS